MRISVWLALALLLFSALPTSAAAPRPKRQVIDYVFLIDTSGSMAGLPRGSGNNIIYPKLVALLKDFVADVGEGSNIFINNFDSGVKKTRLFRINGEEDIPRVQGYIGALKFNGNNTWLYSSLSKVIDQMAAYRRKHRDVDHLVLYYVYTDGEDNQRGGPSLKSVMDKYRRMRGKKDWLFFVNLGLRLKPAQVATSRRASASATFPKRPASSTRSSSSRRASRSSISEI